MSHFQIIAAQNTLWVFITMISISCIIIYLIVKSHYIALLIIFPFRIREQI